MKKQCFNSDWFFRYADSSSVCPVQLPHDAQLLQKRTPESSDGGHGYFPGGKYIYTKSFLAPKAWKQKTVMLEFEGIYKDATVLLNGETIAFHAYGYSGFTVTLNNLQYDANNELCIIADNTKLPNSRWYTGGGIYRPVWLWIANK